LDIVRESLAAVDGDGGKIPAAVDADTEGIHALAIAQLLAAHHAGKQGSEVERVAIDIRDTLHQLPIGHALNARRFDLDASRICGNLDAGRDGADVETHWHAYCLGGRDLDSGNVRRLEPGLTDAYRVLPQLQIRDRVLSRVISGGLIADVVFEKSDLYLGARDGCAARTRHRSHDR